MSGPVTNRDIAETKDAQREADALERARALRSRSDLGNPNNAIREEIAQRRAAERTNDIADPHARALKHFDATYGKTLMGHPSMQARVLEEYDALARKAAAKGGAMDWTSEITSMGEKLYKEAGLPGIGEQRREETIRQLKRARGQE